MNTRHILINPGPVVTPASNPHRVGASNHHQNGSGQNPMVSNETTTSTTSPVRQDTAGERVSLDANNYRAIVDLPDGVTPGMVADKGDVLAVNLRRNAVLIGGMPRQGKTHGARLLLAQLVTGVGELLAENEELRAERDAANDSVLELLFDLDQARAERGVA